MTLKLSPGVHLGKESGDPQEEVLSTSQWPQIPEPFRISETSGIQDVESAGTTRKGGGSSARK